MALHAFSRDGRTFDSATAGPPGHTLFTAEAFALDTGPGFPDIPLLSFHQGRVACWVDPLTMRISFRMRAEYPNLTFRHLWHEVYQERSHTMSETANERGGIRVALLANVRPGEMTTVEVQGVRALLANVGGTPRALRDRCSHEEAPLSEGELEGWTVVCPWHFGSFCPPHGRSAGGARGGPRGGLRVPRRGWGDVPFSPVNAGN